MPSNRNGTGFSQLACIAVVSKRFQQRFDRYLECAIFRRQGYSRNSSTIVRAVAFGYSWARFLHIRTALTNFERICEAHMFTILRKRSSPLYPRRRSSAKRLSSVKSARLRVALLPGCGLYSAGRAVPVFDLSFAYFYLDLSILICFCNFALKKVRTRTLRAPTRTDEELT